MELDELKTKWVEHDRKLDLTIRLSRELIRETYTRRIRFALWRLAALLGLGSILMLAVIVWLDHFIAQNWLAPRFVLPAVVLDAMSIAALVALIAQIRLALKIDYNQPVAVIQRRLETLRKLRVRYVQAIIFTAALVWMPGFIILMKAFLGVDVYSTFATSWIWANVAFGLIVLALGIAFGRRFLPDVAGYNLKATSGFFAMLAKFENE